MAEHVVLVGMMGAGKTTVGLRLASLLGRPFLDSDDQVKAATGRAAGEFLRTEGEVAFRKQESNALLDAVVSEDDAVIAVAGGAVLDPDNRRAIERAGTVIWLRADVAILAARLGGGSGRPLLEGDVPGNLARLYAAREPLYAEVADHVVDVDGLDPAVIAERIAALL